MNPNNNSIVENNTKPNTNIIFNVIHFSDNNNNVKYDEYYTYNENEKTYMCNLCNKINPTKNKFIIKRHLNEQHLFKKEICEFCNKEILRLNDHIKTCKKYIHKEYEIDKIQKFNLELLPEKGLLIKEKELSIFSLLDELIIKSNFKESEKIVINNNIFFYKNKLLGYGSSGNVFLGGCKNNKEFMAIKVFEAPTSEDFDEVKKEKNILVSSRNKGNFPIIIDWDFDEKYIYFAETLMGPSLKDLLYICEENLDNLTILNIAIDLFQQIEILHGLNILHGDIKTSNICYGNLGANGVEHIRNLGLIDFSSSKFFKNKNKINNLQLGEKCICTREYASTDVLKGKTPSRKDDLESIVYVIIQAAKKQLPWQRVRVILNTEDFIYSRKNENSSNFNKKISKEKQIIFNCIIEKNLKKERLNTQELIFLHENFTSEEICQGMENEYRIIYDYIKNLKYKEKPNYKKILGILYEKKENLFLNEQNKDNYVIKYNNKKATYKFIWEKILIEFIEGKINFKGEKANETLKKLKNKFGLNLKKYIEAIILKEN